MASPSRPTTPDPATKNIPEDLKSHHPIWTPDPMSWLGRFATPEGLQVENTSKQSYPYPSKGKITGSLDFIPPWPIICPGD